MIVVGGLWVELNAPEASASLAIRLAMRSLMDPPALKNSHLQTRGVYVVLKSTTNLAADSLFNTNSIYSHHRSVPNTFEDVLLDSKGHCGA